MSSNNIILIYHYNRRKKEAIKTEEYRQEVNELNDKIDELQQELDKYKLVASGKIFYKNNEPWIKSPDIKDINPKPLFKKFAGKQIEIFIKQIGKEDKKKTKIQYGSMEEVRELEPFI